MRKSIYEICKKLKDNGYPQEGEGGFDEKGNPRGHYDSIEIHNNTNSKVYRPHLEELIHLCGEHFVGLIKKGNLWTALYIGEEKIGIDGDSPEEAVAFLWIKIYGKKTP